MSQPNERCVGIDLGTTNSLIGEVVEGKVKLYPDPSGNDLLPSAVGMDETGTLLVGRAARNRRLIDPDGTSVSVKRKMGTAEMVRVGDRTLTPPQVSALILGALLDRVEAATGQRPARAIITVPAFFSDAQRQATKDAGQLAGLTVERLVNEPTAAAMTYQSGEEQVVMVYDLGGGTFDVSILERDEGFLEVRASRGDTHLGGDDVDAGLVQLVLERLGEARAQVTADPRAMTRLLEAVERAKIALSEQTEYRLLEPFLTGEGSRTVQLDQVLTRADIDQVARPLIERTLRCIDEALADAKLSPQALDRVLLVGGASRSPVVREMVANHLQRPVLQDLDADRAVALGASLLAGRTAGIEVKDVLVDITPHTLAVGVEDGFSFSRRTEELAAAPVIPRNTVLPVERTRTVFTIFEDQPGVKIPVVQGESPRVGGNTQLGEVHVQDLPPSPANSPVEVTFRLDLSGILHVTARHVPSDRSAQIVIANSPYQLTAQRRDLDRLEVEALRRQSALAAQQLSAEEAERLASPEEPGDEEDDNEDEGEEPLEVLQERARSLLAKATGLLAIRQDADSPEFRNLRAAHNALKEALESGSPGLQDSIDALADALLDLEE